MNKYYTRACNFYYGTTSKTYIKKKKSIPLNGYNHISFDKLEIIDRKKNKIINIKDISKLSTKLKKKVYRDLKNIKKKKIFKQINLSDIPIFMGIVNLTPDSFSDGGNNNKKNLALKYGWEFGGEIAGHIIGQYPHEKLEKEDKSNYIHPENQTDMYSLNKKSERKNWIFENKGKILYKDRIDLEFWYHYFDSQD